MSSATWRTWGRDFSILILQTASAGSLNNLPNSVLVTLRLSWDFSLIPEFPVRPGALCPRFPRCHGSPRDAAGSALQRAPRLPVIPRRLCRAHQRSWECRAQSAVVFLLLQTLELRGLTSEGPAEVHPSWK